MRPLDYMYRHVIDIFILYWCYCLSLNWYIFVAYYIPDIYIPIPLSNKTSKLAQ